MVTLDEIAARAGVSVATVSRVVNDRAGVAPPTRARVVSALRDLGYSPRGARALAAAPWGTGLIGLVIPELANPVFPAFAQALEARLVARDRIAVLCASGPPGVRETDYIDLLAERGVEGMIFVSAEMTDLDRPTDHYRDLHAAGVPMVFVNGRVAGLDVPVVATDERDAARRAVRHLVTLGHRRLAAIVGPLHFRPALDKRDGFAGAVAEAGLPDAPVVSSSWGLEGGAAAMAELVGSPSAPTGVVCASDLMAIGAMQAARAAGLDVPGDVSIVGFDDTLIARHSGPPLTTIRQNIDGMAEVAVDLLVASGSGGPDGARPLEHLFRPELVVRASTGPPPDAGR